MKIYIDVFLYISCLSLFIASAQPAFSQPMNHPLIIASGNQELDANIPFLEKQLEVLFQGVKEDSSPLEGLTIRLKSDSSWSESQYRLRIDRSDISLYSSSSASMQQAMVHLLELMGLKLLGPELYSIAEESAQKFPQQYEYTYTRPFAFTSLLYPDAYEPAFRAWYGIDWYLDDFGVWGHSFDQLVSPKAYFDSHPEYFAWYEGERHAEALCLTHPEVRNIAIQNLKEILAKNPEAKYYSISQMDDLIYCECDRCADVNAANGGPQGSLYFFVNQLAQTYPDQDFVTLAYLYSSKAPTHIRPAKNVITMLCPISMDRGAGIKEGARNQYFKNEVLDWKKVQERLFVWDYTVQFTHYFSPFPNLEPMTENIKFYHEMGFEGLFMQGYADIPGSLYALRQYLLVQLMRDPDLDASVLTREFLEEYYGKAAPYMEEYLLTLADAQKKSSKRLGIYGGPVQAIFSYLSPEIMDQLDQVVTKAEKAVRGEAHFAKRIAAVRMDLEYTYFEQAKYYGKDQHGMYVPSATGYSLKEGLNARVKAFADQAEHLGAYELSEAGPGPQQYYQDWLGYQTFATVSHRGESADYKFISQPSTEYNFKKTYGLQDGLRGSSDFSYNWTGWYGDSPVIEFTLSDTKPLSRVVLNFLEDQRHWIFLPEKVKLFGYHKNHWKLLAEVKVGDLEENWLVDRRTISLMSSGKRKFSKYRVEVSSLNSLPKWRKRRNKMPMTMIDEIEIY